MTFQHNARTLTWIAASLGILPGFAQGEIPVVDLQPTLVINESLATQGIYPSRGTGSAYGDTLGFVYDFAGNFSPGAGSGASYLAQGESLSIQQNAAVFSILGTTYGGNGVTNFALPNLAGLATIGAGNGLPLGLTQGSSSFTILPNELPGAKPQQQPISNAQPSLALEPLIATTGIFPSPGGSGGSSSFLGQIAYFAGNFVPAGWTLANGQLLSIQSNAALFSLVGTTYGGNGITNFALPNLVGRLPIGAGHSQMLGTILLGSQWGSASSFLTVSQTKGLSPFSTMHPSLAVNYLIATNGIFPSRDGGGFDQNYPLLGQISAFAGTFVPGGWLPADGRLLPISQYQALFSILGTTYGGNGTTNFALPDLEGRTPVGYGAGGALGSESGLAYLTLNSQQLPSVPTPTPEPGSLALVLAGLGLLVLIARPGIGSHGAAGPLHGASDPPA